MYLLQLLLNQLKYFLERKKIICSKFKIYFLCNTIISLDTNVFLTRCRQSVGIFIDCKQLITHVRVLKP